MGKIESQGKGQHRILRLTESGGELDVSDEIQIAVRLIDFLRLSSDAVIALVNGHSAGHDRGDNFIRRIGDDDE